MSGQGQRTIPDGLLLNPSSKIISCQNGKLSVRVGNLHQVIRKVTVNRNHLPVILLSIVGSPSVEKDVLCWSFAQHYEGYSSDQSGAETDKFAPNMNDLSESGVYLLYKPYYLQVDNGTHALVWILYLYQGESGSSRDRELLEIFLTLISSRVAEVTSEMEQIRMLRKWHRLREISSNICHSFLHIFPKENAHPGGPSIRLITGREAWDTLLYKIKLNPQGDDEFQIEGVGDIDLIEVNKIRVADKTTLELFLNIIRELHQVSGLYFKLDSQGRLVKQSDFQQFMEACVKTVNEMARTASSSSVLSSQNPLQTSHASSDNFSRGGEQGSSGFNPANFGGAGGTHDGNYQNEKEPHQLGNPNLPPAQRNVVITTQPQTTANQVNSIYPDLTHPTNLENPGHPVRNSASPQQEQGKDPEKEVKETELKGNQNQITNKLPPTETELEIRLARQLIPEVTLFYNEEMKRFLSEDLFDPEVLNNIHQMLSNSLASQFTKVYALDEVKQESIRNELKSSLDACFPRHSQSNSENWKMRQAKISKCLQKMMSLYMEKIENVLQQHPQGIPNLQLEGERDQIVHKVEDKLAEEVHGKIRKDEPMHGHLNSLRAEIAEYWECVEERNSANLEKPKPQTGEGSTFTAPHDAGNYELRTAQQKSNSKEGAKAPPEAAQPSTHSSQQIRQGSSSPSSTYQNQSDNELVKAKLALDDVAKHVWNLLDAKYILNDRDAIYKLVCQAYTVINNRYATLAQVQYELQGLNQISRQYTHYYTQTEF